MIRRVTQVLLATALLAGAWLLRPVATESDAATALQPERPTFVTCIGRVERSLSGQALVGSVVRGDVSFDLVPSSGDPTVVPVDPAGGAAIDMAEIGAAGDVGVLTEMTTADAAASIVLQGGGGAATAACTPAATGSILIPGGSTMTGETLDLVVTNPYAVDAVASVGSSSENGDDSASEIASLLVPAGRTVVRSLDTLLPLRQSLSVRLRAERGAFHAALVQTGSDDVAVSEGVPPAQDWWVPVLAVRDASTRLVVATESPLSVAVQIDAYTAGEVGEAVFEGTIDPRSQLDIDVAELGGAPVGLRVSSDAPVAVALVVDGADTRAISPATTLSTEWILPGSGSFGGSRGWFFNPGEVAAELVLQPLTEGQPARAETIPPRRVVSLSMEAAGAGMLIRSTSEVAVLWSSRLEGFALGTGEPLAALTE